MAGRVTVEGRPVAIPGQEPPDPKKIQLEIDRAFIRVQDDPTMGRLREIVVRHRIAHAEQVLAELERRFGTSGIEEKANRAR